MVSIIDQLQFVLPGFVQTFLGGRRLPALEAICREQDLQRELHYKFPYVSAVLRCMELRSYRALPSHSDAFIAKKVGVSEAEIKEIISRLLELGIIRPCRGNKYEETEKNIDTRGNSKDDMRIFHYWAKRAEEFINALDGYPRTSHAAYSVWAVSPQGARAISEAYFEFFYRLRAIVSADRAEPEVIQVLNLQILDLDELK